MFFFKFSSSLSFSLDTNHNDYMYLNAYVPGKRRQKINVCIQFYLLQIFGPKTIQLHRKDGHGFGFTLRHFIVYPPDSCTVSYTQISHFSVHAVCFIYIVKKRWVNLHVYLKKKINNTIVNSPDFGRCFSSIFLGNERNFYIFYYERDKGHASSF